MIALFKEGHGLGFKHRIEMVGGVSIHQSPDMIQGNQYLVFLYPEWNKDRTFGNYAFVDCTVDGNDTESVAEFQKATGLNVNELISNPTPFALVRKSSGALERGEHILPKPVPILVKGSDYPSRFPRKFISWIHKSEREIL